MPTTIEELIAHGYIRPPSGYLSPPQWQQYIPDYLGGSPAQVPRAATPQIPPGYFESPELQQGPIEPFTPQVAGPSRLSPYIQQPEQPLFVPDYVGGGPSNWPREPNFVDVPQGGGGGYGIDDVVRANNTVGRGVYEDYQAQEAARAERMAQAEAQRRALAETVRTRIASAGGGQAPEGSRKVASAPEGMTMREYAASTRDNVNKSASVGDINPRPPGNINGGAPPGSRTTSGQDRYPSGSDFSWEDLQYVPGTGGRGRGGFLGSLGEFASQAAPFLVNPAGEIGGRAINATGLLPDGVDAADYANLPGRALGRALGGENLVEPYLDDLDAAGLGGGGGADPRILQSYRDAASLYPALYGQIPSYQDVAVRAPYVPTHDIDVGALINRQQQFRPQDINLGSLERISAGQTAGSIERARAAPMINLATMGAPEVMRGQIERARAAPMINVSTMGAPEVMRGQIERIRAAQIGAMQGYDPGNVAGTAFADVEADPLAVEAQRAALTQLGDIIEGGGMTAIERAQVAESQRAADQWLRGQREADISEYARRGMPLSGAVVASRLADSQDAAQRHSLESLQTQAMAQQRAMDAILARGGLAGQVRGQSFSEGAQRATAEDQVAFFNAQALDQANRFLAAANNDRTMNQASLEQGARLSNQSAYNTAMMQDVANRMAQQQFNASQRNAYADSVANRLQQTNIANAGYYNTALSQDVANRMAQQQFNASQSNLYSDSAANRLQQANIANAGYYNTALTNDANRSLEAARSNQLWNNQAIYNNVAAQNGFNQHLSDMYYNATSANMTARNQGEQFNADLGLRAQEINSRYPWDAFGATYDVTSGAANALTGMGNYLNDQQEAARNRRSMIVGGVLQGITRGLAG